MSGPEERRGRGSNERSGALPAGFDMSGLGCDFPLPGDLRRKLLKIPAAQRRDSFGETRPAELDAVPWLRSELSPELTERLLAIPERHGPRQAELPAFLRGPGVSVAASFALAVAVALAPGDPVALGRGAAEELRTAAAEYVLAPLARAGESIQSGTTRGLESLMPPADRLRSWFRRAPDSSAETARDDG